MRESWPRLSPRVAELFRQGATVVLDPRAEWLDELHAASLSGPRMRAIAEDPVLAEGVRRTNLANLLHWAAANVQRPGQRVPPALGQEALGMARDLVRRGLDTDALDSYRTAQSVAWRRWMEICFGLTSDPAELRELLDVSSLSISTYLDDTIAAVTERMNDEWHDLRSGTHAERRTTVTLLLEGAPVDRARAEAQLGYRFAGHHTAVIVWTRPDAGVQELESAAEAVMRSAGATSRLTVIANAMTLWLWLPVKAPTAAPLAAAVAGHPRVYMAAGRPGTDLDGFRRSHLDAAVTQQLLANPGSRRQVASYADVQLAALMNQDAARADEFVADTLGAFADSEPELHHVVLTYLREQCNASRAAERLYTHRNTVLRRLARADELLPRPLAENLVQVAAALDLLAWRTPRADGAL